MNEYDTDPTADDLTADDVPSVIAPDAGAGEQLVAELPANRPDTGDRRAFWDYWHKLQSPPSGTVAWLQWAVTRFPAFYDAPQPAAYQKDLSRWCAAFDKYGAAQSSTLSALCGFILDMYNSGRRWKCRVGSRHTYPTIADATKNMDSTNRQGLAALIIHARGM